MHDALHESPNNDKAPGDLAVQTAPSADLIAVARLNSERQGTRPSRSPLRMIGDRDSLRRSATLRRRSG